MKVQAKYKMSELKLWVVYNVYDAANGDLVYVGNNTVQKCLQMPEFVGNPRFDINKEYVIDSLATFEKQYEAYNYQCEILKTHRLARGGRPLDLVMTRVYGKQNPVVCCETGKLWQSAGECAKAIGCTAGRISNHLNLKPGHKSIHGKTYRRVNLTEVGGIDALVRGYILPDALQKLPTDGQELPG